MALPQKANESLYFYFAESNTETCTAITLALKDKTSSEGVSVLVYYVYRHQKYCEAVCYMLGVSDAAIRENDTV